MATSNHIHLLVWDSGLGEIAASMQLVAARTAQEYNRRKSRQGAYWSDRYHATAVQEDGHLLRCMTYIDLNMVRAGVVQHPAEWEVSGYTEIQSPWKRKGIIDFDVLRSLLGCESIEQLARRLRRAAETEIGTTGREPAWSESVGVGDEEFLTDLKARLGSRAVHKDPEVAGSSWILMDAFPRYIAENQPENRN
jgi:hypothetical protein